MGNSLDILPVSQVFSKRDRRITPMLTKKTKTKSDQRSKETMTLADIRRAQKMFRDLRLKLRKVQDEMKEMMNHIPHCP